MNYLAHVFLSHQTPDAIVGAMLGDFVKGGSLAGWPEDVRAAIRLHRAIDGYTDRHEATRASCALVSPARRRFAGVLVDIFYDHFLARHWARFHPAPLAVFTRKVYAALWRPREEFPPRLRRILPSMVRDDWLAAYADVAAVNAALNGMARRFRYVERAAMLSTGVQELERNYAAFEANFFVFFPQVRDFAQARSVAAADADRQAPVATAGSG